MYKTVYIVILFGVIIFFSCNSDTNERSNYSDKTKKIQINKIVFGSGGCFGECPMFALEINSDLEVKYRGVMFVENTGFYRGKVSKEFWNELELKLNNMNFLKYDSAYFNSADSQSSEIYIYYSDNKCKLIQGMRPDIPRSLDKFYSWLTESISKMNLEKTNDSLKFITACQFPLYFDQHGNRIVFK
jgi:hypothetical protein